MARTLEDMIRERAHAIWEREGRPEGEADAHWFQAKDEIRRRPLPGWSPEHSWAGGLRRRRDWVVLSRRAPMVPAAGIPAPRAALAV